MGHRIIGGNDCCLCRPVAQNDHICAPLHARNHRISGLRMFESSSFQWVYLEPLNFASAEGQLTEEAATRMVMDVNARPEDVLAFMNALSARRREQEPGGGNDAQRRLLKDPKSFVLSIMHFDWDDLEIWEGSGRLRLRPARGPRTGPHPGLGAIGRRFRELESEFAGLPFASLMVEFLIEVKRRIVCRPRTPHPNWGIVASGAAGRGVEGRAVQDASAEDIARWLMEV